jgi:uncharacterized protein with HEPN domain
MDPHDRTRLNDMLDAARKAREFAVGKTREAIHDDDMLYFALVRAIEIVGEAASRITPETRAALPDIPWRGIVGMRNKVIHDYLAVDRDIVWDTATGDLPPLIDKLEEILTRDE